MAEDTKVYVPKQKVTRGVPGYKGGPDLVVVDPATGKEDKSARKPTRRGR